MARRKDEVEPATHDTSTYWVIPRTADDCMAVEFREKGYVRMLCACRACLERANCWLVVDPKKPPGVFRPLVVTRKVALAAGLRKLEWPLQAPGAPEGSRERMLLLLPRRTP
jgi:hypothetical protein